MPESKGTAGRKSGMAVDTRLVRELAEMLGETGLVEIEVEEGDRRIRVSRGGGVAMAAPAALAPAPQPAAAPAELSAGAPAEAAPASHANAIKSPMVGTAYLAGEPGADPYVSVGDAVKKGQTLLIVEAMKVMNPITAPADGMVKEILVGNSEPVEYDQPLIVVA